MSELSERFFLFAQKDGSIAVGFVLAETCSIAIGPIPVYCRTRDTDAEFVVTVKFSYHESFIISFICRAGESSIVPVEKSSSPKSQRCDDIFFPPPRKKKALASFFLWLVCLVAVPWLTMNDGLFVHPGPS